MNPVNHGTDEDEESMDGGSEDELTDVEDVFVSEEAEMPKRICCDQRPSKEEVELHNKTHLPYRSWCPHCVRGQARRRNRRKRRKRTKSFVPVISLNYMWMKGKTGKGQEESNWKPDSCGTLS